MAERSKTVRPREIFRRQRRQISRHGYLFLAQKYMRDIGAGIGDRLRIKVATGKVTLTLEPPALKPRSSAD